LLKVKRTYPICKLIRRFRTLVSKALDLELYMLERAFFLIRLAIHIRVFWHRLAKNNKDQVLATYITLNNSRSC
jgi:hypothetical protein